MVWRLPLQCPGIATGCRHCSRTWALPSLRISLLTTGRSTAGTGLRARSPSHTWLPFGSRHQSWFGSNSAPAGKLLPGSGVKATWTDLNPAPKQDPESPGPLPQGTQRPGPLSQGGKEARALQPPFWNHRRTCSNPGPGFGGRGGLIPLTSGSGHKCLLSRRLRERRSQRRTPASFVHNSPVPGRLTLYTQAVRSWGMSHPCLLPLMTRSWRGAQALGKSHCWPVFRRDVGIPY